MSMLSSVFVDEVRCRANLPEDEGGKTATLVKFANQEIQETIWPEIVGWGMEFFLTSDLLYLQDTDGNMNFPAGFLPVPTRSYARTVRDVKLVDKTSLEDGVYKKQNLPHIPIDEEDMVEGGNNQQPGFAFVNDGIKLFGDMREMDQCIELRYVYRPPTIESSSSLHGDISALNYSSGLASLTVTVGTDLNTYCADGSTKLFDIWRKSSGSLLFLDVPLSRSGTTFTTDTLNAADIVQLAGFQKGGFTGSGNTLNSMYSNELMIMPAERTNYIPLHPDIDTLAVLAVVRRVLEMQGDVEMLAVTNAKYRDQIEKVRKAHVPRSKGEAQKIVNRRGIPSCVGRW